MKFFIRSEKGAVSIYLIIITTMIFFFNAVLIDFARIMAAERKTENAVKAGVRSVLSAYDAELQRYGLYVIGISEDDAKNMFNHVVHQNLSSNLSSNYFQLIDTLLEEETVDLQFDHTLAQHETIEQQILEEMKYRAPAEFLLEVADKLSPIEKKMRKASEDVKESKQEISKFEGFKKIMKKIDADLQEMIGLQSNIHQISNIIHLFEQKVEEDQEANRAKIRESYLKIMNEAVRDSTKIIELERALQATISEAIAISKNLKEYSSDNTTVSEDTDCNIPNTKEYDLDFKELGHVDFPSYIGINHSLHILRSDLQSNVTSPESIAGKVTLILYDHDVYFDQVFVQNDRVKKFVNKIDQIENEAKKIEKCYEKHRETTDKELDTAMGELENNVLNKDDYKGLKDFYKKYKRSVIDAEFTKDIGNHPSDLGEEAISLMEGVFRKASSMVVHLRNEAYINEYALTKFNYLTFPEGTSFDPAHSEEHRLKQQEAEYILYGMHMPKVNIASALTEVFTFRLAIRTIEGFEKYKYLGVPKLIAIAAATHGIINANQDLKALKAGQEVVLTKYTPKIKLNYLNYIRFFLFIHSDSKANKLSRIQSLIELNTNKNLEDKYTYVRASASTSIRLWFIPGVMKALHNVGVLDGQVEGNRYQIVKLAAMSY